ncbi:MAG: hypothetical protein QM504_16545, partial [Pseudomonadota bacterium]
MDTSNNIKITVEPTKNNSVSKSESPVTIDDSGDPIQKAENKDSFSDALEGEMKNNENSQENVSSEPINQEGKEESGNKLPNEEEITLKDGEAQILE